MVYQPLAGDLLLQLTLYPQRSGAFAVGYTMQNYLVSHLNPWFVFSLLLNLPRGSLGALAPAFIGSSPVMETSSVPTETQVI